MSQSCAKFISLEGSEGVGKTTAINELCQYLDAKGIRYVRTREPGGSAFAEKLRALLLDPDTAINVDTELLLMFAARADHLHQTILPALDAGVWVVCDRFLDSTLAYQGYGREHGDDAILKKIAALSEHFVPRLPDMTLWLDLDVQIGMERAAKRSAKDRFEALEIAFFERVRAGFATQAAANPDRIHRIDASGAPDDVLAQMVAVLGV
ncbi:dTMP kinase [Moraxella caviae]|uniref:Thymidylate kinase n=1 Tax=Moraxella caviae TaxID=34060 RepID=A0A1T0A7L6_9GAMM|nr:dTMP kinase [Moraxella caviae]OOR91680.1 dTMP kinase [Moraxella caviae]STZ10401.1 Thymidylate kinase [Moraxella caviae]